MKKVRIQLLQQESELSFEIHDGITETVEGQSLPVNEILIRFQRGTLDMPIAKQIYYDNVDDFVTDPTEASDFDLADATMLRDNLNNAIAIKKAEAERQKAEAERQKAEAQEIANKESETT